MTSIARCDDIWTAERFAEAIGGARPAWVETLPSGELAILIKVVDAAILIRYAAARGGYHWTGAAALRRRADCDGLPEPAWLQQARASAKPPLILHDLLTPAYSRRALERVEVDGARVASLDPTMRGVFEEAARLGRVSARHAVDPWLTRAERDPLAHWPTCVSCGVRVPPGQATCGRLACEARR